MASYPVEKKVKAATSAATFVGLVIAVLNWAIGDSSLLGTLPGWAQALIVLVVPPLITFLSGYQAAHTPRPLGTVLYPED